MGNVDYDSSRQGAVPAGAEGFAALLGQAYTLRLSPQGKVLDVNGVEEMVEAVRKKAAGRGHLRAGQPPEVPAE